MDNITILPISGGGCFSQISILAKIAEYGYDSELMLGASGGNIAAYICHASNFKSDKMTEMALELHPKMFCKPWVSSIPLLSCYCGYTKGSLYDKGDDNSEFLRRNFQGQEIGSREIWSAAYDIDSQRSRLFCNRSKETSIMNPLELDSDIYQVEEPIFAGGRISLMSKIISASAAIPLVVPPQIIMGNRMQDAGLSCASPMTLMAPLFKKREELHMYYINSEDINIVECMLTTATGLASNFTKARDTILKNMTANDRRFCYELLLHNESNKIIESIIDVELNKENWSYIQNICSNYKRTLVEIYPKYTASVDIGSFKKEDAAAEMEAASKRSMMRIWYC